MVNTPRSELINFLILTLDPVFGKQVQMAFALVPGAGKEKIYKIHVAPDYNKFMELIDKANYHSILVDETFLSSTTPEDFLPELTRAISTKIPSHADLPIIYACSRVEISQIRNLITLGYTDIFLKPLDTTLFVQKMNNYNKKIKALLVDELYTMDYARDVTVHINYRAISLSEYSVRVETSTALPIGTPLTIHTEFTKEPFNIMVRNIEKLSSDAFIMDMMFIGLSPSQTQTIRQALQQHYAKNKSVKVR